MAGSGPPRDCGDHVYDVDSPGCAIGVASSHLLQLDTDTEVFQFLNQVVANLGNLRRSSGWGCAAITATCRIARTAEKSVSGASAAIGAGGAIDQAAASTSSTATSHGANLPSTFPATLPPAVIASVEHAVNLPELNRAERPRGYRRASATAAILRTILPKIQRVGGQHGVPVQPTGQAAGPEEGGLFESCAVRHRGRFPLEPCITRKLHLRGQLQVPIPSHRRDSPEVDGVLEPYVLRMSAAAAQPNATDQRVKHAADPPSPVIGVVAS